MRALSRAVERLRADVESRRAAGELGRQLDEQIEAQLEQLQPAWGLVESWVTACQAAGVRPTAALASGFPALPAGVSREHAVWQLGVYADFGRMEV